MFEIIGPKTTLVLKRITKTTDTAGGWTEALTTVKSIKGVLSTIRGDERLSADKKTVIETHNLYTDYPRGFVITESDELYYGLRKFKILYINNLGANMNKRLKITLKEIT